MALTSGECGDRALGKNESIRGAMRIVWFATANNPDMRSDTTRRAISIRLEAQQARPEDRDRDDYRHPDLIKHIKENRAQYVADVLTILRAWVVAGAIQPPKRLSGLGSFEGWSDVVRACILWIGMEDPEKSRKRMRESADKDGEKLEMLFLAWRSWSGDEYRSLKKLSDILQKDESNMRMGISVQYPLLREALDLLTNNRTATVPKSSQIMSVFRRYRNKIIDAGLKLERSEDRDKEGFLWRVIIVDAKAAAAATARTPSRPYGLEVPAVAVVVAHDLGLLQDLVRLRLGRGRHRERHDGGKVAPGPLHHGPHRCHDKFTHHHHDRHPRQDRRRSATGREQHEPAADDHRRAISRADSPAAVT
jgi:hypothetical protein